MRANYPFLFEEKGMFLVIDIKWLLHMHVIVCVVCGNFRTKFFFFWARGRGENVKLEKNQFFLKKKWKIGNLQL